MESIMTRTLSHDYLRSVLSYDQETGEFIWIKSRRSVTVGMKAGTIRPDGYIQIGINGCLYMAHRLAWLYVYGHWPDCHIDHINGQPSDNRITNLRDATPLINAQNKHAPVGVRYWPKSGRYQALIGNDRKQINIGSFGTFEEARNAYITAKRRIHSGCTI